MTLRHKQYTKQFHANKYPALVTLTKAFVALPGTQTIYFSTLNYLINAGCNQKKYIKTWYSPITGDPVLSKETIPILH